MNFSYPFYDTNSPYYDSDKLWSALELSSAGGFTLGGNGFWHGGVHFESGAGVTEHKSIRAIADGKVVAYRLNEKYLSKDAEIDGSTTDEYSTGFVLIKHTYQSLFGVDAQGTQTTNKNELTFYSLYMHVKPYSEYDDDIEALSYCEGESQYEVTNNAIDGDGGLNMRENQSGSTVITQLPVNTRVKISEFSDNDNWGKVLEIVSGYEGYTGNLGWIYLNNDETKKLTVPNQFDSVRNLSISNDVKAGQKIGYMGKYDAPASSTNGKKQLHLEIFTTATQSEITAFLSNSANVNLPKSHDLYKIAQNSPFATIQEEAVEGSPLPAPTFTEIAETHFQNILVNNRSLEAKLKTDSSNNKWLPLNARTHTADNIKDAQASEGWVKVTGSDPCIWPGFDNPPLDAVADGVSYYEQASPTTLMATLIKRVEPSYISGAETPITRQAYTLASKQVIAKDAVSRSIIKHKAEWSSAYTTDLIAKVTEKELIEDDEKRARFQQRKEELDFWDDVTGLGTDEAYYFHPLAFIDNMMRMEAYYEAVIHVSNEIKTAIVLNESGTVSTAPDYGAYNSLVNGYTVNNIIYCKKKSGPYSYFPTYKGFIYRGIGNEAKINLAKDIENGNRNLAESDVFELARHTKVNNRNYDTGNPVPPTADNKYYEVKYRLSSTYRYRISTPREEFSNAFPNVTSTQELQSGLETIVSRAGVNVARTAVSFDPWKSKSLEGCLGFRGNGGTPIGLSAGITNKYINISNYAEGKVPELKGVYGRLHANQPSAVTEYDKQTRVWLKVESLPDVDYIKNGGQ